MKWKPKKWIAAVLGFVSMPIGMLYAAQPLWAVAYFFAGVVIAILEIFLLHRYLLPMQLSILNLALPIVCGVHASRLAGRFDESRSRPWYAKWYGLVGCGVVLVFVLVGNRAFLYESFRYPGNSMLPSIKAGSYLVAQKWGYGHYSAFGVSIARTPISSELSRGDVIVFELPANKSTTFAQRLIGLPGDKVLYKGKRLWINGVQVEMRQIEDYLYLDTLRLSFQYIEKLGDTDHGVLLEKDVPASIPNVHFHLQEKCIFLADGMSCEVPPGHYFVMGDNRDMSRDSRYWGFLPADHVVGKVIYPI